MAEQNVVDAPSHGASDDFGSHDFGNRDSGDREFGSQDFGNQDFDGGSGEAGAPGQGQSKSSRRRRRKRKNKVVGAPGEGGASIVIEGGDASAPGPFIMEGESIAAAAAPAAPQARRQSSPQPSQQPQGQNQQGQGTAAGGKRWKKKFRDRERRPAGRSENPGNDFRADSNGGGQNFSQNTGGGFGGQQNYGNGGGGGFKRKGKQGGGGQRKDRSFVGPMDHSYREVNGNFADPSASTIQTNGGFARKGRHHGDSQPIDHSMPRAIPIPEGAQTHIYFFIEDLFFTAKIQETARKQGVKIAFVKNEKDAVAELTSGAEENKPALIVFDLNNANAKPLTLIPKLKAKLKKSVSVIGFLSHLQGDLKAKAVEAGCDAVMARAAFSQNLPNLLRRYSAEEEDEYNYNQ